MKREIRGAAVKKNHLKIICREITSSLTEIVLNGKPLRDVVSIKVELSGKRDDQFVKVTAEFYSSFELDGFFSEARTNGRSVELSDYASGSSETISAQASQPCV
jgi:hypothetical protein